MAIRPPEQRLWWNEPVERAELVWIAIAFLWGVFMFLFMIWWHFTGAQNLSNEAYRIDPARYAERTEASPNSTRWARRATPAFRSCSPPPGSDVYMYARLWEWWPVLELERGQSYRLHLSSLDWQHGFSLQPVNINVQVHPGYEHGDDHHARQCRRVQRGLQRVLRHRPPHHARQDPRGRAGTAAQRQRRKADQMATTVEDLGRRTPTEAGFRICPVTGLRVHLAAQTLIKANAVAAVVFLAIGGLFGLLVALTRWPAVHLLPAEWFYLILTAHGLDVLLFWIIFFEIAILYFASAVLLELAPRDAAARAGSPSR